MLWRGGSWLARAGAPWRLLPNDLPPWQMVYQQFRRWHDAGCFDAMVNDWLTKYNEYRPHDALGGVPPKQFMPRLITTTAADSRNQLSS